MYPSSINNLMTIMEKLPGIGEKTAERLVFSLLDFSSDDLTNFSNCLIEFRDNVDFCSICGNITDHKVCDICLDNERDNSVVIVVEKPKDILLFEKLKNFNGKYHVLNGLISPLDGIGPEQINLASLVQRVVNCNVKEIILAIKPNIEGDTTMYYIKKLLDSFDVKVTKIATGIPVGTEIEYLDTITLKLAIDGRKDI